jgi:hypothetical protein
MLTQHVAVAGIPASAARVLTDDIKDGAISLACHDKDAGANVAHKVSLKYSQAAIHPVISGFGSRY